jgi:hypothetical protein
MNPVKKYGALLIIVFTFTMAAGCTGGGGSSNIRYGVGMGYHTGYYGRAPYGYHRPDIIIGPDDGPTAMPLSGPDMDFGMPDAGFDDFGGFDDF